MFRPVENSCPLAIAGGDITADFSQHQVVGSYHTGRLERRAMTGQRDIRPPPQPRHGKSLQLLYDMVANYLGGPDKSKNDLLETSCIVILQKL
jgi:hypothetical protein